MLDKITRPMKEKLLAPFCRFLGKAIHPTAMTFIAFAVGLASAACIFFNRRMLGLGLFVLNRILDGLDGGIARATGRQTDLGGYLDILMDFVLYAAIPVMFVLSEGGQPDLYLALTVLLGVFYVNGASWMYLSAILEKRRVLTPSTDEQTSVTMPGGLVEGTETIIFYCLFFLFPQYLKILFYSMAALTVLGTFQRIVWAVRHLKKTD